MARLGLVAVLLGQVAVLLFLSAATGLGLAGWVVGLGWAAAVVTLVARGLGLRWRPTAPRAGVMTESAPTLGPANRVTLLRTVLVGAVAALVVDGLLREER